MLNKSFSAAMRPTRYVLMITAPVLATSVLLLVVGGASAWYVHRMNLEVSASLARNLECTLAAGRLVLGVRDARFQMHRFLETGDEADLRAVSAIQQATSQSLNDAEQSATTDDVRDLIRRTRRGHERLLTAFAAMIRDMTPEARRQNVRELTQMATTDVLAPAQELLDRSTLAATTHSQRSQTLADQIGLGLLLLGACGAVGGMMAGYGISHGVSRRIEQMEREATRSEQLAAVGQLAAGLAHEIRNPLTAMRVLVEAGGEQEDGLDRRDLEVLDEEITRLERLVKSFLDFARPPQLEKATLDARSSVEQTLNVVAGAARQRAIAINFQPPAEPVAVEADPIQLRQVLLNLLLNAMDAAGENGRVTVELEAGPEGPMSNLSLETSEREMRTFESRPYSRIHVSDSGTGVPDDMKERIFEPFVSTKETGMGLGLAVSRRIVVAHGGSIRVADNSGGGARFTICLPCGDKHPVCRLSSQIQ